MAGNVLSSDSARGGMTRCYTGVGWGVCVCDDLVNTISCLLATRALAFGNSRQLLLSVTGFGFSFLAKTFRRFHPACHQGALDISDRGLNKNGRPDALLHQR